MKTTNKQIKDLVSILDVLSGYDKNCTYQLKIDYNSNYGGYRLVLEDSIRGTHLGVFGESSCMERMNRNEFYYYLKGLTNGINHKMKHEGEI